MNYIYEAIKKELTKASNTVVFSLWEAESAEHKLEERRKLYATAVVNKQIAISLYNMLYYRKYISREESAEKIKQIESIVNDFNITELV